MSKDKLVEGIAETLHCAGLNAFQNYNSMGQSAEAWNKFRLELAQAIADRLRVSDDIFKKVANEAFRTEFVPLYPKDKPISEMTPYEQGLYKQILRITLTIHKALSNADGVIENLYS